MNITRIASVLLIAATVAACAATPTPTTIPSATAVPTNVAAPTSIPTAPPPTIAPAPPTTAATPAPGATATPDNPMPAPPLPIPRATSIFNPATGVRLEPYASGLSLPVDIKHAGDGSNRLFVVEKRGTIRVVRDGAPLPAPFLEISAIVNSAASERGLLGLAFHPDYRANGRFYVYYTDASGDIVVARYQATADPNVADPNSRAEVLRVAHRGAANHNGGGILFGPDGYLYIGTGDGGGAGDAFGNSQKPDSLLAKLLRIDVNGGTPYGIPRDNPFVNRGEFAKEIWAWGLRNPWRFSFDRATRDLYIADVGQNVWEEVNFQPAASKGGENYGWNLMEGNHCFRAGASCNAGAFVAPVAEYSHSEGGCSITGGYVYRGKAQPALAGAYFYGDYCSGKVWALSRDAGGAWRTTELLTARNTAISSFGEDEAGEVYLADYNGGTILRLVANR